jgi:hypothetical protein
MGAEGVKGDATMMEWDPTINRPMTKDVRAHDGNTEVQEEKKWVVALVLTAVQTRRHHH